MGRMTDWKGKRLWLEQEKEIKKLIKMIMEAIILMISWHYKTMITINSSKTEHVEK